MANEQNLKPFTGVDDPRRHNGRPKGSKNLATVVRELENEDFDWSKIPTKQKNLSGSPWQAIVYTAIAKAVKGDIRAMEWLRRAACEDQIAVPQERFSRPPIIMADIKPRFQTEEQEQAYREAKQFDEEVYNLTGRPPLIISNIEPYAREQGKVMWEE